MRIDTTKPGYVMLFAALVGACLTAGIMTLHVATAERVRRNERVFRARAKVELFGLGDVANMSDSQIVEVADRRVASTIIRDPDTGDAVELLTAYDADKQHPGARAIGRGIFVSGIGFWARISGILAVTPDLREITGVVFLEHSETPGLGARITEKRFRDQFRGLRATAPGEGLKFIYIDATKPAGEGDPRSGRRVDAITGATGTSSAVERFINQDLRRFRRAAEAAGLVGPAGSDETNRRRKPA